MDKINIKVELYEQDVNTEKYTTRSLELEQDFDGSAGEIAEMFRAIMNWLTFMPGTIDKTVASKYDEDSHISNSDCSCTGCDCDVTNQEID